LNVQPAKSPNHHNPDPNQGPVLDLKQIKQIIDLMKRSELTEFAVEEEGFKLKIRRGPNGVPIVSTGGQMVATYPAMPPGGAPSAGSAPATPSAVAGAAQNGEKEEAGIVYVKAPMVGTFYRAPSPESPPFVETSSKVAENTVVCIIEAMKIMNEIQAEVKGSVVEVFVENGQPVEYGQRLFKIKQG
jgi:acetyl-CoA carboxylase biotin carboxyl carrier protein